MRSTMKKVIALIAICFILLTFVGCGRNYQDASQAPINVPTGISTANGYFTVVKHWGGGIENDYYIVYANDTKVMYFIVRDTYVFGVTPLYNADGTLQVYAQ